jgi:hypothetical protein
VSGGAIERIEAPGDAAHGAPRERWELSPGAAAFIKERAQRLRTDPATVLEDIVLVERRRCEGAL